MVSEERYEMIQETEGLRDVKHSMKFRVVNMTPAVAAGLLKSNHPKNRKPKETRIAMYAGDMLDGVWQLTHEAIAVDEDGWLIDGQNRLQAVIDSGKSVPMLLITGVPKKALLATDQGLQRSVADVAKITGQEKPGMPAWSSLARAMLLGTEGQTGAISVQEVLHFMKVHDAAMTFAMENLPAGVQGARGICQARVRAAVARAYYLPKTKHDRVKEFCKVLLTGLPEHPKKDSAAIRLRNWLGDNFLQGQRQRHKGMRPHPSVTYSKTQTALRAFIQEQELEQLRETSEQLFPLPEEK